jgi:(p)ppGpp synthase/HD superfamily hydrolase
MAGGDLARAVRFAQRRHTDQTRRGSDVPAVAHLLGVAALVLEDGGRMREAVAAVLHDVVEDTDTTIEQVRKRFGGKVARIVAACTDAEPGAPRDAANWHERRARSLARLRDPATSQSVVRVEAADALQNVRSLTADLRRQGPAVWQRFHAGAVDQLWYLRSVSIVVSTRLPGWLADELRIAVGDLERVSGWWFDVGDPQPGGPANGRGESPTR